MLFKLLRSLPHRFRRIYRAVLGLLLALAGTQALALEEDVMKGAYLYSLMKFVEWPTSALPTVDNRFFVCVLGDERLSALTNTLQQKSVHDRQIAVVNLARQGSRDCQVVFIAASEAWRLQSLLAELADRPVLTVGETAHFAGRGGMIEFVLDNQRLGFEINHAAALRAGLRISAQLLQLAKAVYK